MDGLGELFALKPCVKHHTAGGAMFLCIHFATTYSKPVTYFVRGNAAHQLSACESLWFFLETLAVQCSPHAGLSRARAVQEILQLHYDSDNCVVPKDITIYSQPDLGAISLYLPSTSMYILPLFEDDLFFFFCKNPKRLSKDEPHNHVFLMIIIFDSMSLAVGLKIFAFQPPVSFEWIKSFISF